MKDLKGKTALITGGAGGLGFEVALRLAEAGCAIALWDLDAGRLDEAAKRLRKEGVKAHGYVVDVTDLAAVKRAAKKVRADLGPVDILDNNAGIVYHANFLEAREEDLNRIVDVNLKAIFWCTKVFLPSMIERGSGHIVMIASAAGLLGTPGMASYSATKHAVVGFSESLRLELRKDGVSGVGITIVCPSFIATGMFDGAKPPRFTRWLTPALIADKIISAIKRNAVYVREPWLVKLIPLLKAIPSTRWIDWLGDLTGAHRSMDTFSADRKTPARPVKDRR